MSDLLLRLLEADGHKLEQAGKGYKMRCPFHDDKNPSCSVFQTPRGRWRYKCFACQASGDDVEYMVQARGMDIQDAIAVRDGKRAPSGEYVPPERAHDGRRKEQAARKHIVNSLPSNAVARYDYTDADANILFVVQRYHSEGKKFFGQYSRLPDGRWQKGMTLKNNRPLYNLFDLLNGDPSKQVLVVEGEKCADLVREAFPKACVVSWFGGCNAYALTDWTPVHGRNVVLCADSNDVGYLAMYGVAQLLREQCGKVQFVLPPRTDPEGEKEYDIGDLIERSGKSPKEIKEWLRQHTRPYSRQLENSMEKLKKLRSRKLVEAQQRKVVDRTLAHIKVNGLGLPQIGNEVFDIEQAPDKSLACASMIYKGDLAHARQQIGESATTRTLHQTIVELEQ